MAKKNKQEKKKLIQEENIEKIREMMEFLVKQKIHENIKHLGEKEKKAYELTGDIKRDDILKTLKMSPNKLAEIWCKLEEQGILMKDGKSYRKVV